MRNSKSKIQQTKLSQEIYILILSLDDDVEIFQLLACSYERANNLKLRAKKLVMLEELKAELLSMDRYK